MPWSDQNPEAKDVLLHVPMRLEDAAAVLEIDKLPDGQYRLTIGDLFGSSHLSTMPELEDVLRHAHRLLSCRRLNEAQVYARPLRCTNL